MPFSNLEIYAIGNRKPQKLSYSNIIVQSCALLGEITLAETYRMD